MDTRSAASSEAPGAEAAWHARSMAAVAAALGVDPARGLTPAEAARRLAERGPNQITGRPPEGWGPRFARQIGEPLIIILLISGALAVALGETVDATVIFLVVLVNATVGVVQEARAQAAIAALAQRVSAEATALRDGAPVRLPAADLVAGDVVCLDAGDRVPADLRLAAERGLVVDEAMLTGESLPVAKRGDAVPEDTPLAERGCMLWAGTHVLQGTARGVVVATGNRTELGRIAHLIDQAPLIATPLTRRLARFSNVVLVAILVLAAATFAVGLLRGEAVADMLMAAVALAVGAIPEGLPAALTITLAIGVHRMARRAAVIRRLPAVEALGSVTVICSDKTGTLTQNRMMVSELLVGGFGYAVHGAPDVPQGHIAPPPDAPAANLALAPLLTAGVLCNNARMQEADGVWHFQGDPTEWALLLAAARGGLDPEATRRAHPRRDELPFDSRHAWMATLNQGPDGAQLWIKGAFERVLAFCDHALTASGACVPIDHDAIHAAAEAMALRGMRVLAFARCGWTAPHVPAADAPPRGCVFLGLQGMVDPARPEAVRAVASCRDAGIRVVMITGDHAATAAGIAATLGIGEPDASGRPVVVSGRELAGLPRHALHEIAGRVSVFARVEPEQKLRLVEALQARGEVVAMTGDGVNDAPALRQADIGVAMGRGGTDVAKASSDMVLVDDNFASIEAAVEEGRGVYDNLLKFIVWTLPTNFAEGLIIFVAVMAGVTLPITPLQILWINMSTALLLGLMLAFEPIEAQVMQRAPRPPGEPILTGPLVSRVVLVGCLLVVGAFWVFAQELEQGRGVDYARTAAVNVFVFGEMFYLLNCRSLTRRWWAVGVASNPWVWFGMGVMAFAQGLITYVPSLQRVFGTVALQADSWGRIIAVALLLSLVVAAEKVWRARAAARH